MKLIVICGGGGKTTLMQKYPHLFLDIDDFVWSSYNTNYHEQLREAIAVENINTISNIYKTIMVNNRDYLQTQPKIILGHDPIYSDWIGVELLVQMKPSINLHESNIKSRSPELKRIALRNWVDLSNAIIYDDWEIFNTLIFKACIGYNTYAKVNTWKTGIIGSHASPNIEVNRNSETQANIANPIPVAKNEICINLL
jgi:hypothetical protein